MKRLLLLVDSRSYIRSNCYQHQLAATLARCYRVRMMSAREIRFAPLVRVAAYDRVLSVLRLRTLVRLAGSLARMLGDRVLYVYEQDVWQAFMDDSPYKGAYRQLAAQLNIAAFLVTSRWWRDFVAAGGLPAKFVRMGMLPEYCNAGPAWEDRPIRLGFQGTLHPHRQAFYTQLAQMGLEVETLPPASYEAYLANLQRMRIYVHTEDAPWCVDGRMLRRNALWIKETEVAARGTFVVRDAEEESEAYDIAELPTVVPFPSREAVAEIVAWIEAMNPRERRDRMVASAETMRRRDDWMTVVQAIES